MKSASIRELKKELGLRTKDELIEHCLAMARFKLETKELLTYLVFESENEPAYRSSVKNYISHEFKNLDTDNYYYLKKSIRRILRQTKRFIRYSKNKETEAEVLIHFCQEMADFSPTVSANRVLTNMYNKQKEMAIKAIAKLHEDLQFDLNIQIRELPVYH